MAEVRHVRDAKSAASFAAEVLELDGCAVVAVTGEIDMATAPALEARIDAVLAAGPSIVVLDLADTAFMDSTGLGVVVRAARRLEERSAKLIVRSPQPAVQRVLHITGVERMLAIEA
jgi:anti-sigma B factor antagonist